MDSPSEMKQTETIYSFPSFSTSPQQTPSLQSLEPQSHTMSAVSDDLVEKPLVTLDSAGHEYRRLSGGDEGEEDGLEEFRRENAQAEQETSPKIRSRKASFEAAPHVAALTEYLMSLPIKELNYGKAGDITDTRAKDHIEALSQALMEDSMSNAKCGASIEDNMFDDDFWIPQPEPPKRRTHSYSLPTTLETLYEDEEFDPLLPKRRSTWVSSLFSRKSISYTSNIIKSAAGQRSRRSPPAPSQQWRSANIREPPQNTYRDQPSSKLPPSHRPISRSISERISKPITAEDLDEIEYLCQSPPRRSSSSDRGSSYGSASSSYGSASSSYGSGSSYGSCSPQSSEFDWDSDSDDYSGCSTPEEFDPPLTSTKELFGSFNYQLPVRKTPSIASQSSSRESYSHKRLASC
jgi:hypothetical protein